jgi:hypothetical protein
VSWGGRSVNTSHGRQALRRLNDFARAPYRSGRVESSVNQLKMLNGKRFSSSRFDLRLLHRLNLLALPGSFDSQVIGWEGTAVHGIRMVS